MTLKLLSQRKLKRFQMPMPLPALAFVLLFAGSAVGQKVKMSPVNALHDRIAQEN